MRLSHKRLDVRQPSHDSLDRARRPRRGVGLRTDGGRPESDAADDRPPSAASHARAVADALAEYDRLVEVAIGHRTDVARTLATRGVEVTAVDRRAVETPDCVGFVRGDATDPDRSVYRTADALYALNLPPELHVPVAELARGVGADLGFTTLGGDPTTVSTRPETVHGGTLHWLRRRENDDP